MSIKHQIVINSDQQVQKFKVRFKLDSDEIIETYVNSEEEYEKLINSIKNLAHETFKSEVNELIIKLQKITTPE